LTIVDAAFRRDIIDFAIGLAILTLSIELGEQFVEPMDNGQWTMDN
jgi:hypothetical protein